MLGGCSPDFGTQQHVFPKKRKKKVMNQVIDLFFFATRKGGSGCCSSLNFGSPKGEVFVLDQSIPGLKKPPTGGPKSQIIGDLRPPKKKGDDLRATWMGPQGCVHLGWGERCKENVLSNIFRVQFFGVFAVTHVLQMES